jgi:hypothetical protein
VTYDPSRPDWTLLQERRVCENTLYWAMVGDRKRIPPTRRAAGVQPASVGNRALRRAAAKRATMKA